MDDGNIYPGDLTWIKFAVFLVATATLHLPEVLAFGMNGLPRLFDIAPAGNWTAGQCFLRYPGCSLNPRDPRVDTTVMLYRSVIWTAKLRSKAHLARAIRVSPRSSVLHSTLFAIYAVHALRERNGRCLERIVLNGLFW
ncbi:hypothetical protein BR93DRAFT_323835 [Coniochaeta sp. PMI_546]|nr:hypothetical protein BR93DRAFT_323835 [Coniochaeta sp. PMI_546]